MKAFISSEAKNYRTIVVLYVKHSRQSAVKGEHSWYISLAGTVFPLKKQNPVACYLHC